MTLKTAQTPLSHRFHTLLQIEIPPALTGSLMIFPPPLEVGYFVHKHIFKCSFILNLSINSIPHVCISFSRLCYPRPLKFSSAYIIFFLLTYFSTFLPYLCIQFITCLEHINTNIHRYIHFCICVSYQMKLLFTVPVR